MKSIFHQGPGPLPRAFYLPVIVVFVLLVGAHLLPDGGVFSFLRGMTIGIFIVFAVATIVGATTVHRRRAWRQETRTLDDLEPLSKTSFDPIERDRP
jgi:uncharacterized membrane protein